MRSGQAASGGVLTPKSSAVSPSHARLSAPAAHERPPANCQALKLSHARGRACARRAEVLGRPTQNATVLVEVLKKCGGSAAPARRARAPRAWQDHSGDSGVRDRLALAGGREGCILGELVQLPVVDAVHVVVRHAGGCRCTTRDTRWEDGGALWRPASFCAVPATVVQCPRAVRRPWRPRRRRPSRPSASSRGARGWTGARWRRWTRTASLARRTSMRWSARWTPSPSATSAWRTRGT